MMGVLERVQTPAKQRPRDITGRHLSNADARPGSPAGPHGANSGAFAFVEKAEKRNPGIVEDETHRSDGVREMPPLPARTCARRGSTILQEKENLEGLHPMIRDDEPDPRIRWASRNGFTTQESMLDLHAILTIVNNWYIAPPSLQQEGEIDQGSFGSIFKGKYKDKPVAIKHISQCNGISFPQVFRAMRLELSIATALQHPNIVQFFGVSAWFPTQEQDDASFCLGFVFELCDEGSLFAHIHKKKSFKGAKNIFIAKINIARDIACGMSYVHEQSIIHRDLSSRNVLLANGKQVKIADFGCARKIVGDFYDSTTISGSPAYMSPEQLQGKILTLKVDVWALGVVLWELLNEQVPWTDIGCNDRKELARKVAVGGARLKKTPAEKLTRDKAAQAAFDTIIDGAFQASVDKRISMAKMYELLKDLIDSHEGAIAEAEEDVKRLEILLSRFYAKHNPTKLSEVQDLARLFQGKEHVLNERLRSSYRVDLTNFVTEEPIQRANSSGVEANSKSDTFDNETPDKETIHQKMLFFYQHLNPSKVDSVSLLLKKFEGNYEGLNQELQKKYGGRDLSTPSAQILEMSKANADASDDHHFSSIYSPKHIDQDFHGSSLHPKANKNVKGSNNLPRGTSAPPMTAPDQSEPSWEEQMEPRLEFFYTHLNPSKLQDVSRVLNSFRNNENGLNLSLFKAYGIDLRASRENIVKEKQRRELAAAAEAKTADKKAAAERAALPQSQHQGNLAQVNMATAGKKTTISLKETNGHEEESGENIAPVAAKEHDPADFKGRLVGFYLAWNMPIPPQIEELAANYVNDRGTLNAGLRDKYHGTDLTWTSEEIRMLAKSLSGKLLVPMLKPPSQKIESSSPDEGLLVSLKIFYKVWSVERTEKDLIALALDYKDTLEELREKQQKKYCGTDYTWSQDRLAETVERFHAVSEAIERFWHKKEGPHEIAETLQERPKERVNGEKRKGLEARRMQLGAVSPKNSEEVVVSHKIADLALKIAKTEASYEEETTSSKAVEEARKKQAEEMAESSRKKAEEDARKSKSEEEAKKKNADEEEAARKIDEDFRREEATRKKKDARKRKAKAEARKKKTEEEEAARKIDEAFRREEEASRKEAEEDARKRKAEEEARKKMAGEEARKKANIQRGSAKKPAASEAKPDTYRQNPAASEAKLEAAAAVTAEADAAVTAEADAAVTAESPAEDEEVARKIDEAAQMSGKQRGITLSPVFDVAKARATQVANAAEVISNFYDAWGVKRSSEDIAILSMHFLEDPGSFNSKLRMKYHGADLSWDLAELRLKCESVGQEDAKATRKAAMTCSDDVVARATIEFISCKLTELYHAVNPEKLDSVNKLAERYASNIETLNESLRSKYGGLDLNSSSQDIRAYAASVQNRKSSENAGSLERGRVTPPVPRVHTLNVMGTSLSSLSPRPLSGNQHGGSSEGRSTKKTLETKLREFYSKHCPEREVTASTVALMYDDDVGLLNKELEKKYGASLDSRAQVSRNSPANALQKVWGMDEQLKDKLAQVHARLQAIHHSTNQDFGTAANSYHSPVTVLPTSEVLELAAGDLVQWYSGPRTTLQERLRMFYYYLNPAKIKNVDVFIKTHRGSEDMVNVALMDKYAIDLSSPEKIIMRTGHLSRKLLTFFRLIAPQSMHSECIKEVPGVAQAYLGREEALSEMLQERYGVGLEIVSLSDV